MSIAEGDKSRLQTHTCTSGAQAGHMASSQNYLATTGGGTQNHQRAGLDNKPAHGLSTAGWKGDLWKGSEYQPPRFRHKKTFCLATFLLSPELEDWIFEHRIIFEFLFDLGTLYELKNEFKKADNMYTQCLDKRRIKLGQYSPYTLATISSN